MRKLIFLFIYLPFFMFSDENYQIKAKKLLFNNNDLSFENGFYLEHSFGKIFAKNAKFSNIKKINKPFDFELSNGVKLITNMRGTLLSERAKFDAKTSKIQFFSDDHITYLDKVKEKDLKIFSSNVECLLNAKNTIKNLNIEDIYLISFNENVILSIDEKLNIFSNRAVFEKNHTTSKVLLYPQKEDVCLFQYENNEIKAKEAKLDLESLDLFLKEPNGTIKNILKKENTVLFNAKKLFWHNFESAFLLQDEINIIDPEFGIIKSDEVEIIKKIKQNTIRKIISRKNTNINFFSKNKSSLKTKGIIELDHDKKCIFAFSSKNQKDNLIHQDLIYEDANVKMTAKKANLQYTKKNDIKKIILENNVHFIYKNQGSIGYGIADKIEYFPNLKLITLLSFENKKVLFYKDDNSLRLSADEIHISQKEKNDIKGVGDVRFTFNLDEENLIHEIFSKYISSE